MSLARRRATFLLVFPAGRLMSVTPPSITGALSFSSMSSTVSETGADDLLAPTVSRTKTLTYFALFRAYFHPGGRRDRLLQLFA